MQHRCASAEVTIQRAEARLKAQVNVKKLTVTVADLIYQYG